uniref:NADH-ubiquinone oxidoreductase chain 1 n=1 Tax=Nomada ruficornis TaxID=601849 RepID=A0A0S2LT87_9HYME|nr:NADH dehydrogenase subunit 1 [Nomada ruficornis]
MIFIYKLLNFLFLILMILISVAFLTLLERKILSYIHNRKGPNKVGFKGLLQPFSDAFKLLSKEIMMIFIYKFMYLINPMLMFFFSMILWLIYPWLMNMLNYSMIFMILILGLSIYPIMFIGWSSNNNYSMLGALRSIVQMISFEISLFLMMFIIMLLIENYSFYELINFQLNIKFIFLIFPIYLMFLISMLIELNRTPFDLIEGESELVSGFNVEYYSSLFTLIFLAEYSSIMFMSMILIFMFMGFNFWSMKFILFYMFQLINLLWIRSILPRIRYDKLMYMCWTDFLIITLIYLLNIYFLKEFFMYFKS